MNEQKVRPAMDVNEDGLTFEAWLKEVDRYLLRICGLTAECLADWPSRDNWTDGLAPAEAAAVCLLEWNDFPGNLL